jgi:release factor glutamine methyltransferase
MASGGPTLGAALARARTLGLDRLDAELLAAHVCGLPRAAVIAHPERALDGAAAARLEALVGERARGVPLAYLLGEWGFRGLLLTVNPDVLIPRGDTETLVEVALDAPVPERARVLDLGTGSGAVALALAAARPHWTITATDRSPAALAVARGNGERLGLGNVGWREGDWFAAVADARFDLIVSNPPYVATDDPELAADVAAFEPAAALFAGPDGLDAIRRIAADAPTRLLPGGTLALEHGHRQGEAVRALLAAAGLEAVDTHPDLAGRPRVTSGRRPTGSHDGG